MNVSAATVAIRTKFNADVAVPRQLKTQYDNMRNGDVADGDTWCRLVVRSGDSALEEIGATRTWRTRGVAIASLFAPFGGGDAVLNAHADAIAVAFRSKVYQNIVFLTPSILGVGRSGPYWQVNVTCPWWLDAHGT